MIGDRCGLCGLPIEAGQVELKVPHLREPDTSIHALCPARAKRETVP